jgi:hypothetical protein
MPTTLPIRKPPTRREDRENEARKEFRDLKARLEDTDNKIQKMLRNADAYMQAQKQRHALKAALKTRRAYMEAHGAPRIAFWQLRWSEWLHARAGRIAPWTTD